MSSSTGQYLLPDFRSSGVRHTFGVSGNFNLWFLEQTIREGSISFVGCCNELNAVYAADGNARLSGIAALVTTYAWVNWRLLRFGLRNPIPLSG